MKTLKSFSLMFCTILVVACLNVSASGQTAEDNNKFAAIAATGSSVRWDVAGPYSSATLTIAAPDGRVFRKEFRAGSAPEFSAIDKNGERLPDGVYTYELRPSPILSAAGKEKLAAARGKDDDPEEVRATRKREVLPAMVQSGSFSITNGAIIVAGSAEEGQGRVSKVTTQPLPALSARIPATKTQQHHPRMISSPDDVIPDDLIVQGSACVGLDCVSGEVFGFDTIRLKENNTRLQFEDTSAAGFPLNNWQIRANSSGAGGASFLAFVDQGAAGNSETGTIVFEVDAGAPANSLKVASNGKVGLRTATPALDVHANTSDTPAIRLEQNNSGGFTAQTWDIAGNEANFFVRDVTSGSRLPFRIRPGAPTSSLDVSAGGSVGIGTANPTTFSSGTLTGNFAHVFSTGTTGVAVTGTFPEYLLFDSDGTANNRIFQIMTDQGIAKVRVVNDALAGLSVDNVQTWNMSTGNVGIGTAAPDQKFSVNGDASKAGGGSWQVFSDERLKTIKGPFSSGLKALMQLQPLRYEYKPDNALGVKSEGEHVGFAAQAVQQVIPEAVTKNDSGYLFVNNDPILWTMLNAIKEQQQEIAELKKEVRKLRTASRRRASTPRRVTKK